MFYLAFLDKLELVHLNSNVPFVTGTFRNGNIYSNNAKTDQTSLDELTIFWDFLGRPEVGNFDCWSQIYEENDEQMQHIYYDLVMPALLIKCEIDEG